MANPRKRPDQRAGKSGRTLDIGVVRRLEQPVPACPAVFGAVRPLAETVAAWERLWSSPLVSVIDLASDLESVVRWAALLDERERAFRAFRKKRVVEGSQGQPVINPLWAVVKDCDTRLQALEDRIGLSPRARLMLGITYAEAGRSLDELNRMMEDDDDDIADPRVSAIDASAS